jgi:hypothetical protein
MFTVKERCVLRQHEIFVYKARNLIVSASSESALSQKTRSKPSILLVLSIFFISVFTEQAYWDVAKVAIDVEHSANYPACLHW